MRLDPNHYAPRFTGEKAHECTLCGTDLCDVAEIVEARDGDACIECARDAGITCQRCTRGVEHDGLCELCLAEDDARAEAATAAVEAAKSAEFARSIVLSRMTRKLDSADFENLAGCETGRGSSSVWFEKRMARLAGLGFVFRHFDGTWVVSDLGREVNAWRKRGPIVSERAVA